MINYDLCVLYELERQADLRRAVVHRQLYQIGKRPAPQRTRLMIGMGNLLIAWGMALKGTAQHPSGPMKLAALPLDETL